jgi:CheY-like chemotaxis protein
VDDLPSNLLLARNLLAPYGLQADTTVSGPQAIELVKTHTYDLIFMDHMMPEMDGVETSTAIRKIESYAHTPIIALTANATRGMREFYLENGFQDYLSKPISPEALGEIINKWLNKQRAEHNNPSPQSPFPSPFSLEIMSQRLDILNHYLASFTCVPEAEWRSKFDAAYFERFTALVKSLVTAETPAELREQAEFLAEAGRKGDAREIRDALPAFCGALQKWREREQKSADNEENNNIESRMLEEILPRLKTALLAGETEKAETAIGELGATALTPAGRELYFKLYALMFEGDTEKIMEAIKEAMPPKESAPQGGEHD